MSKRGFTILEVTLFLAISGSLALIAFAGLGPRLRNAKFSGAVRAVEASIESNVSASSFGRNTRTNVTSCSSAGGGAISASEDETSPVGPGGAENCVANGILVLFGSPNKVEYRRIVSLSEDNGSCDDDTETIDKYTKCHSATVLPEESNANASHEYTNGLKQSPANGVAFAVIQHPITGQTIRLKATPNGSLVDGLLSSNYTLESSDFEVCYSLENRKAKLNFSTTKSQPEAIFNEECST